MFHVKFHYSWLPGQQQSKSGEMQLFGLLEGIHREGSLRAACQQVGLSYRYAWGLLGRWSEHFGQPLAMLEQGRGAFLTPLGKKLLWAQQRVQARLAPQIEALSAELERELASAIEPDTARIDIVASHDLALTAVRDHLARNGGPRLDVRFQGSVACLAALEADQAEVAGFHAGPEHAEADAFRRMLNPRSMSLIRFVTRRQGLILTAGNPKRIRGVKDLVRTEFINRQAGSGTRLAFDRLLSQAKVGTGKIAGYQNEEFTHLAVAATIASGHAEAGMGIEAAARQYGLDFLPLFDEAYFLACRTKLLDTAKMQKLLSQLAKPALRQMLAKIPGYGVDGLGTLIDIDSAFKPSA